MPVSEKATSPSVRRITGSADIPLSPAGRQQAKEMVKKLSHPFEAVFCGPENRMMETAEFFGDPIVLKGLDAWKRGQYEGKPADSLKAQMRLLMLSPNKKPPGKSEYSGEEGQSHSEFLKPLVAVFEHVKQHTKPGERVLLVTSGGGLQAIDSYLKSGSPKDLKLKRDPAALKSYWSETGQLFKAGPKALGRVDNDDEPGVYLTEHGATDWNSGPPSPKVNKAG